MLVHTVPHPILGTERCARPFGDHYFMLQFLMTVPKGDERGGEKRKIDIIFLHLNLRMIIIML